MDPFQVLKRVAAAHRIKLGAITLTAIGVALRHHHALSRKNRRSHDQTKKDKKIKAYDPRKGGISVRKSLAPLTTDTTLCCCIMPSLALRTCPEPALRAPHRLNSHALLFHRHAPFHDQTD